MASARRPWATRRSSSICQRRSWACTKPWAKSRSSSVRAQMWGTPMESRHTCAGAARPGSRSCPSTCGRAVSSQTTNVTAATAMTTPNARTTRPILRMDQVPGGGGSGCPSRGPRMAGTFSPVIVSNTAFSTAMSTGPMMMPMRPKVYTPVIRAMSIQ